MPLLPFACSLAHTLHYSYIDNQPAQKTQKTKAVTPTPIPNARKCTTALSPPRLNSPRSPLPVAIPIFILAIVLIVLPPTIPLHLSVLVFSMPVVAPPVILAIAITLLFTLVFVFYSTVS